MFVKPAGLPVMHANWQHNGGNTPYPAHCAAFNTPAAAWAYLAELHEKNTPYNLLYSKDRLYIFPRQKQGCYAQPDWTSGFTWHELAGGMITFNRESFASLDQATIAQELAKLDSVGMKKIHVVIPDLFLPQQLAAYASADLRLPALEKLLARARAEPLQIDSLEQWLCERFGVDGYGDCAADLACGWGAAGRILLVARRSGGHQHAARADDSAGRYRTERRRRPRNCAPA